MSSDVYALLDSEATVYLFKQSRLSVVIDDAPTLEDAVNALLQAAPPKTIKGVYILSFSQFERCRRSVEAVQKAGYTVIELVETIRYCMSSFIYNLPLKQTIGSFVFVVADSKGQTPVAQSKTTILRKCEKGWKLFDTFETPSDALANRSLICEVVFPQNISEADKAVLNRLFPGWKLHPSPMMQSGWLTTFFQNRINNGNLNGYEVQPFCPFNLIVNHGTWNSIFPLPDTPPFTMTKEIDVGNVPEVEIRVAAFTVGEISSIKTFKFESAAFRTVSMTVTVDKTLLPQVTLKTIATRESAVASTVPLPKLKIVVTPTCKPHDSTPSFIFFVTYSSSSVVIVTLDQKKVTGEKTLPNFNNGVAFMRKQTSDASKAIVVIQYVDTATVVQLQTVQSECQKAGFFNLKLVSYNSMAFSLLLASLQAPIDNGTLIAILNPKMYYIVTRDGRNFKVQKGDPLNQFDVDRCDARKVVISNAYGCFGKATLKAVRKKFRSNLHEVADMSKLDSLLHPFLWNYVDETTVNTYAFNNFCDFDISIVGHKVIPIRFKEFPISVTIDIDVSHLTTLEVNLVKSETKDFLKKFTLRRGTKYVRMVILAESCCDVTTTIEVIGKSDVRETVILSGSMVAAEKSDAVTVKPTVMTKQLVEKAADAPSLSTSNDAVSKKTRSQRKKMAQFNAVKTTAAADEPSKPTDVQTRRSEKFDNVNLMPSLPKELSQLQLNPPSTTILTFTSDNRVLIKADATYTGVKEVLAFVRLETGTAPIVGQQAFDALKTRPAFVFYDITRLLAADVDPAHPDPNWTFKTSRDADGKVLIHGGDNITTFPIVLFGVVVNSTLLYIKEHQKSEVTELGIRLPSGSVISDSDLKAVAQRIGVKLMLLVD